MTWSDALDLAGFDMPPAVCVRHLRFVPCRSGSGPHITSSRPEDVERVRKHQEQEERKPRSQPAFEVVYCGPGGHMSPSPPDAGYSSGRPRITGTEVVELPGEPWTYEVQVRWDFG